MGNPTPIVRENINFSDELQSSSREYMCSRQSSVSRISTPGLRHSNAINKARARKNIPKYPKNRENSIVSESQSKSGKQGKNREISICVPAHLAKNSLAR